MRFRLTETGNFSTVSLAYVDDIRRAGLKVDATPYRRGGKSYCAYEDVYVHLETAEDFWKLRQAVECEIIVGSGCYNGKTAQDEPELELYNDYRE